MNDDLLMLLAQRALELSLFTSAPVLGAVAVVGLLVAVVQTATSVQEAVVGQVVKLLSGALALALTGHWVAGALVGFTREVLLMVAVAR